MIKMEAFSELSQATLEVLARDWMLWSGLFAIILTFTIYVYLFPRSIDFFVGGQLAPDEVGPGLKRVREEPPLQ